jgi:hypothetical protein
MCGSCKSPVIPESLYQWVFPQENRWKNRATGEEGRHHTDESLIQKAVKLAVTKAGLTKRISCHNTIIDLDALVTTLELKNVDVLRMAHREWIEETLRRSVPAREEKWSQSIAVGSEEFAHKTQATLGVRGHKRDIVQKDDVYVLRETEESYGAFFGVKNGLIVT